MISRDHGDLIFECDTCGETLETHDDEWSIAWNMAKCDGWTSRKQGTGWQHHCGTCNNIHEEWPG